MRLFAVSVLSASMLIEGVVSDAQSPPEVFRTPTGIAAGVTGQNPRTYGSYFQSYVPSRPQVAQTAYDHRSDLVRSNAGSLLPDDTYPDSYIERSALGIDYRQTAVALVHVTAVVPNGSAARAGMRSGDRIMTIGNTHIAEAKDVPVGIMRLEGNRPFPVQIERDGQQGWVWITPADFQRSAR